MRWAALVLLLVIAGCTDMGDMSAADAPDMSAPSAAITDAQYSYRYNVHSGYRVRSPGLVLFATLQLRNLAGANVPVRVYSRQGYSNSQLAAEIYVQPDSDDATYELTLPIPLTSLPDIESDRTELSIYVVSPWSNADYLASSTELRAPLNEKIRRQLSTVWQLQGWEENVDLTPAQASYDYGIRATFKLTVRGQAGRLLSPTLLIRRKQDTGTADVLTVPAETSRILYEDAVEVGSIEFLVPYRLLAAYIASIDESLPILEATPVADWEDSPDAGSRLWIDLYPFGGPNTVARMADDAIANLERQQQQLEHLQRLFEGE